MKCETCKYWKVLDFPTVDTHGKSVYFPDDDDAPELSPFAWGRCDRAYSPRDKDSYLLHNYPDQRGPRSERMTVWDASDYAASLSTRSDFGCVEWEIDDGEQR